MSTTGTAVEAGMSDEGAAAGCGGCCGTGSADAPGTERGADASGRAAVVGAAEQLAIGGDGVAALVGLLDDGDCPAVQDLMTSLVQARLGEEQERLLGLVERAAAIQTAAAAERPGMPQPVADLHAQTVGSLELVARLQGASVRLAEPALGGACTQDCACATAASVSTADAPSRIPATRRPPVRDGGTENAPDVACTLDGGTEAMTARIGQWQAVIGKAVAREPADGGITLVYEHDQATTVELARLGAAEFACCSFFTFSLTVGPPGMRFTVTAPPEAQDLVTAVFGAALVGG